jgi:hypothetical protein
MLSRAAAMKSTLALFAILDCPFTGLGGTLVHGRVVFTSLGSGSLSVEHAR